MEGARKHKEILLPKPMVGVGVLFCGGNHRIYVVQHVFAFL